jgi:hypothetical protein
MKRTVLVGLFSLLAISSSKAVDVEVKDYVDKLKTQLNKTPLYANDRRKVQSYLRRYYDTKINNKERKARPLAGDAKAVADSIANSYQAISRMPGNHQKAAEHYLYDAAGVVALSKRNPADVSRGVRASRATERAGVAGTTRKRSGGVMGDINSALGGDKSKAAAKASVRNSQTAKPKVVRQVTKNAEGKTVQTRTARRAAQLKREKSKPTEVKKKRASEKMTKEEFAAKKRAKLKRKMERIKRENAARK